MKQESWFTYQEVSFSVGQSWLLCWSSPLEAGGIVNLLLNPSGRGNSSGGLPSVEIPAIFLAISTTGGTISADWKGEQKAKNTAQSASWKATESAAGGVHGTCPMGSCPGKTCTCPRGWPKSTGTFEVSAPPPLLAHWYWLGIPRTGRSYPGSIQHHSMVENPLCWNEAVLLLVDPNAMGL